MENVKPKHLYGWDEAKRSANVAKHGIDFVSIEDFDWTWAHVEIDDRDDYGELREIAWGFIGDVLHTVVFTRRDEAADEIIWIISLRRSDKRELRKYVEATR